MSSRNPAVLFRVVATGGKRQSYWEPASKTYGQIGWARSKARHYRSQGAVVEIFKAELTWTKVEDE